MDKAWSDLHGQLHPVGVAGSAVHNTTGADTSPIADGSASSAGYGTAGLKVSHGRDAMLIRLGPGRQKTMAAVFGSVGLLFAATTMWLPDQGPGHWIFMTVLGVFSFALLLVAGYLPFSVEEIRVDHSGVSRLRLWAGLVLARRSLPSRSIGKLSVEAVAAIQNPARCSYRLVASGDFGSLCLLELCADRLLLESLQQQIMAVAALSRERVSV